MRTLNQNEINEVSGGTAKSDCIAAVRSSIGIGASVGTGLGAFTGSIVPGVGTAMGGFLGGALGGLGAGAYTIANNPSCGMGMGMKIQQM